MLDGYTYYVVEKTYADKKYACAFKIHNSTNIAYKFSKSEYTCVHACQTFKEAKALAKCWNEEYKKNGTYMS